MTKQKLNEHERKAIVNALRVAAERYKEHTDYLRCQPAQLNYTRLADQFDLQRKQALAIANEIEQADSLTLE